MREGAVIATDRPSGTRIEPMIITITYTVSGREYTTRIARKMPLTHRGAERIIRRTHPGAIVTRVEAASG